MPTTLNSKRLLENGNQLEVLTVVIRLNTSLSSGLSEAEANASLARYGHNRLPEYKPRAGVRIVLAQLTTLTVTLLTAAAGLSLFTEAGTIL